MNICIYLFGAFFVVGESHPGMFKRLLFVLCSEHVIQGIKPHVKYEWIQPIELSLWSLKMFSFKNIFR